MVTGNTFSSWGSAVDLYYMEIAGVDGGHAGQDFETRDLETRLMRAVIQNLE